MGSGGDFRLCKALQVEVLKGWCMTQAVFILSREGKDRREEGEGTKRGEERRGGRERIGERGEGKRGEEGREGRRGGRGRL